MQEKLEKLVNFLLKWTCWKKSFQKMFSLSTIFSWKKIWKILMILDLLKKLTSKYSQNIRNIFLQVGMLSLGHKSCLTMNHRNSIIELTLSSRHGKEKSEYQFTYFCKLLKVLYPQKNIGIIFIAPKMCFVFWIFPPLDTAGQLESADSKHNTISKSFF